MDTRQTDPNEFDEARTKPPICPVCQEEGRSRRATHYVGQDAEGKNIILCLEHYRERLEERGGPRERKELNRLDRQSSQAEGKGKGSPPDQGQ